MNQVKFLSLGGIGDVTKNLYVYETDNDLIVVDCGVGFPDVNMLGVDLVLPDITYILKKINKLRGIFITHAHEDHLGALPYLWPDLKAPIYATRLTASFIENRFEEVGINNKVNVVSDEEVVKVGDFYVEYIHVNHSVPDSCHLVIKSGTQTFYHGSDFKFDWTPVDEKPANVNRIATVCAKGITCLMSDCLGSERPGYTFSEKIVGEQLEKEMAGCGGKFIVTAHSSDICRWQMVVDAAVKNHRKLTLLGRSVEQAIDIGRKLGYLSIPDEILIDSKKIKHTKNNEICVLVSGSQGQPNSALARIANNEHSVLKIEEGDIVVFSADPIPGNENFVHASIDALTRLGAQVSYSEVSDDLHVSGHAGQQELLMLIALTKPKYLIPIGGTYRHMKKYAGLAQEMGYHKENIFIIDAGQQVEFQNQEAKIGEKTEVKNILIDGLGVGDVGNIVLKDRQQLAKDGIVTVVLPIEAATGRVSGQIDILSRGFVYMKQSDVLISSAIKRVEEALISDNRRVTDWQYLRNKVEKTLARYFYQKTARRPLILSVIVEV